MTTIKVNDWYTGESVYLGESETIEGAATLYYDRLIETKGKCDIGCDRYKDNDYNRIVREYIKKNWQKFIYASDYL